MAGSPASSAYAIPWGTSSVVTTRPATRSLPSSAGRYDRSIASPGIARENVSSREVVSAVTPALLPVGSWLTQLRFAPDVQGRCLRSGLHLRPPRPDDCERG